MEELPERRRLVPLWAVWAAAAVALVAIVLVVVSILVTRASSVPVPNVVGLDARVARSRLAEQGLKLQRGDTRFSSTVPAGGVVAQTPKPGAKASKGSAVVVIVSGGSESFPLPDVVGVPLPLARSTLQDKGLVVQTEVVASDRPKNQVVATKPAAGVTMSATDVVKLSISSGKGAQTLQPSDLTGRTFILDPAPVSSSASDTPMEVQRRLNSLLEASGAKVVVTRTIVDQSITPPVRAQRAAVASATAVIGLDVEESGAPGLGVTTVRASAVTAPVYLSSTQLSQILVAQLQAVQPGVRSSEVASDPVLVAAGVPGARIRLGALNQPKDVRDFGDPEWEDAVARALYAAIAKVYGTR